MQSHHRDVALLYQTGAKALRSSRFSAAMYTRAVASVSLLAPERGAPSTGSPQSSLRIGSLRCPSLDVTERRRAAVFMVTCPPMFFSMPPPGFLSGNSHPRTRSTSCNFASVQPRDLRRMPRYLPLCLYFRGRAGKGTSPCFGPRLIRMALPTSLRNCFIKSFLIFSLAKQTAHPSLEDAPHLVES
jgi:hypothetical protein